MLGVADDSSGEIQIFTVYEVRVRFDRLGCEKEAAGWEKSFIGLGFARFGKESREIGIWLPVGVPLPYGARWKMAGVAARRAPMSAREGKGGGCPHCFVGWPGFAAHEGRRRGGGTRPVLRIAGPSQRGKREGEGLGLRARMQMGKVFPFSFVLFCFCFFLFRSHFKNKFENILTLIKTTH